IDGIRILFVAGIEVVDIGGVGALQKRGKSKSGVRVLTRHDGVLVISCFAHGIRRGGRSVTDQRVEKNLYPICAECSRRKEPRREFQFKSSNGRIEELL